MLKKTVNTYISVGLYNLIKKEKEKLIMKEKKRCKTKRRKITFFDASNSIANRLIRW